MRSDDPTYDSLCGRPDNAGASARRIYGRSRACCAASNWVADSLRDDYGAPPSEIHVVGLGRNTSAIEKVERDWSCPASSSSASTGRASAGPRWSRRSRSCASATRGATLDLVGAHPPVEAEGVTGHGPLRSRLGRGPAPLGGAGRRATCFLMPSPYEPFGIAYVDAGAAGVPSIGTTRRRRPGRGRRGRLVVDPNDDRRAARGDAGAPDPATARRLGELARTHSALFTWRAVSPSDCCGHCDPAGLELDHLIYSLPRPPQVTVCARLDPDPPGPGRRDPRRLAPLRPHRQRHRDRREVGARLRRGASASRATDLASPW